MRAGVLTVYRWELRKLRAQKRTYLGLGAAAAVPIIFGIALATGGGHPNDVAFGRYVHDTGLAVPLVLLLFGSIWLFPLITALVAGDIVASEDRNSTLKTILTRSVERHQIFLGKTLAATTYAILAIAIAGVVATGAGVLASGFNSVTTSRGPSSRPHTAWPWSGRACSSTCSRSSPLPASACSSQPSFATAVRRLSAR